MYRIQYKNKKHIQHGIKPPKHGVYIKYIWCCKQFDCGERFWVSESVYSEKERELDVCGGKWHYHRFTFLQDIEKSCRCLFPLFCEPLYIFNFSHSLPLINCSINISHIKWQRTSWKHRWGGEAWEILCHWNTLRTLVLELRVRGELIIQWIYV
jgi:hypothetical protein